MSWKQCEEKVSHVVAMRDPDRYYERYHDYDSIPNARYTLFSTDKNCRFLMRPNTTLPWKKIDKLK